MAAAAKRRYGWPVSRQRLLDGILALLLTAQVQAHVWRGASDDPDNDFEQPGITSPLMLCATAAVAFRHRAPFAATIAFSGAAGLQALVTADFAASPGLFLAGILLLYAVAAHADRVRAFVALGVFALAMVARDAQSPPDTELDVWNASFFYLVLLLAFAIGLFMRSRRQAAALKRRTARLERERRDREAALAEERARIAQELHDIVAHSVSAAVVHSEAAEEVLTASPERARASLHRIQGASRDALGEMRRLLGVMRGGEARGELTPHRGLADLPTLADDAAEKRFEVRLCVTGELGDIPPGIDLSAFRIVQEALTNARRHAGRPARVDIELRRTDHALEVNVVDDGCGAAPAAATGGAGFGLLGMHERAAFFGGTLDAGPRPRGGFAVRARFPLPREQTAASRP
jgi:signal transduction histidine kinase